MDTLESLRAEYEALPEAERKARVAEFRKRKAALGDSRQRNLTQAAAESQAGDQAYARAKRGFTAGDVGEGALSGLHSLATLPITLPQGLGDTAVEFAKNPESAARQYGRGATMGGLDALATPGPKGARDFDPIGSGLRSIGYGKQTQAEDERRAPASRGTGQLGNPLNPVAGGLAGIGLGVAQAIENVPEGENPLPAAVGGTVASAIPTGLGALSKTGAGSIRSGETQAGRAIRTYEGERPKAGAFEYEGLTRPKPEPSNGGNIGLIRGPHGGAEERAAIEVQAPREGGAKPLPDWALADTMLPGVHPEDITSQKPPTTFYAGDKPPSSLSPERGPVGPGAKRRIATDAGRHSELAAPATRRMREIAEQKVGEASKQFGSAVTDEVKAQFIPMEKLQAARETMRRLAGNQELLGQITEPAAKAQFEKFVAMLDAAAGARPTTGPHGRSAVGSTLDQGGVVTPARTYETPETGFDIKQHAPERIPSHLIKNQGAQFAEVGGEIPTPEQRPIQGERTSRTVEVPAVTRPPEQMPAGMTAGELHLMKQLLDKQAKRPDLAPALAREFQTGAGSIRDTLHAESKPYQAADSAYAAELSRAEKLNDWLTSQDDARPETGSRKAMAGANAASRIGEPISGTQGGRAEAAMQLAEIRELYPELAPYFDLLEQSAARETLSLSNIPVTKREAARTMLGTVGRGRLLYPALKEGGVVPRVTGELPAKAAPVEEGRKRRRRISEPARP